MFVLRIFLAVTLLAASLLASAQSKDVYRLATGDKVSISVFGESDFSINVTLDDDGILTYPFIGDISVAGLTVSELERTIADGLRGDYLINPDVTVTIEQYRSFFIQGEANRPGSYEFQPGLTLEKALAVAGGLSSRAAKGKIRIKRADSETFEDADIDDPVYAGDVIDIPPTFF